MNFINFLRQLMQTESEIEQTVQEQPQESESNE